MKDKIERKILTISNGKDRDSRISADILMKDRKWRSNLRIAHSRKKYQNNWNRGYLGI